MLELYGKTGKLRKSFNPHSLPTHQMKLDKGWLSSALTTTSASDSGARQMLQLSHSSKGTFTLLSSSGSLGILEEWVAALSTQMPAVNAVAPTKTSAAESARHEIDAASDAAGEAIAAEVVAAQQVAATETAATEAATREAASAAAEVAAAKQVAATKAAATEAAAREAAAAAEVAAARQVAAAAAAATEAAVREAAAAAEVAAVKQLAAAEAAATEAAAREAADTEAAASEVAACHAATAAAAEVAAVKQIAAAEAATEAATAGAATAQQAAAAAADATAETAAVVAAAAEVTAVEHTDAEEAAVAAEAAATEAAGVVEGTSKETADKQAEVIADKLLLYRCIPEARRVRRCTPTPPGVGCRLQPNETSGRDPDGHYIRMDTMVLAVSITTNQLGHRYLKIPKEDGWRYCPLVNPKDPDELLFEQAEVAGFSIFECCTPNGVGIRIGPDERCPQRVYRPDSRGGVRFKEVVRVQDLAISATGQPRLTKMFTSHFGISEPQNAEFMRSVPGVTYLVLENKGGYCPLVSPSGQKFFTRIAGAPLSPPLPMSPQAATKTELRIQKLEELLPLSTDGVQAGPPTNVQNIMDSGAENDDSAELRALLAVAWVVDALNHAYLDPQIKKAATDLITAYQFSHTMDTHKVFNSPMANTFRISFRGGLKTNLDRLGCKLKDLFDELNLGEEFGEAVIDDMTTRHPLAVTVSELGRAINQADLVPDFPATMLADLAANDTLRLYPEQSYLLVILLTGIATDCLFQAAVRDVAVSVGLDASAVRSAVYKSYVRARNKMWSHADHRGLSKPRPKHNVDIIRNLVMAMTPDMCKAFYRALLERFGGAAKVKNLYALSENERAERFNLVSLMVTLVFDPGMTFGELCQQPETRAAWDAFIAKPQGEPTFRWAKMCGVARRYIESSEMACRPVLVFGEVQILLSAVAEVRHVMHEPYKGWRAEECTQLYDDYMQRVPPTVFPRQIKLISACHVGQLDVVEEFLSGGEDVDGPGKHGPCELSESLFSAIYGNHLDVVQLLLAKGADVNSVSDKWDKMGGVGVSCLTLASGEGHLDIVQLLLSEGAEIDQHERNGRGKYPLNFAAGKGHLDVVKLLVEHNANLNTRSQWPGGTGNTPLGEAINGRDHTHRRSDVVEYLRSKGARTEGELEAEDMKNRLHAQLPQLSQFFAN